jgi:phosphate starvation-inducible PhoH-like protein
MAGFRKKEKVSKEYLEIDEEVLKSRRVIKPISDIDLTELHAKTENQSRLQSSIRGNIITISQGPAGTGKTFVSIYEALKLFLNKANGYKEIVLIKSLTPLKGEDPGHLPGDLNDKIDPVMDSFICNAKKIVSEEVIKYLVLNGKIVMKPLSFLRGHSIDDSIIILDESQNVSHNNARTVMTRIGANTKLIMLGDSNQIDISNIRNSSLSFLVEKFSDVKGIGVVTFTNEDIVRNKLIKTIEKIFQENKL